MLNTHIQELDTTINQTFTNTRESLLTTYIHKAKRQRMTANSPKHTYKPTTHLEITYI